MVVYYFILICFYQARLRKFYKNWDWDFNKEPISVASKDVKILKGILKGLWQSSKMSSTFELWLELAWLGAKCKGKKLLVIEIFFTLHRHCTVTVQYWCSVCKAKHNQVFSAALLIGRKIQISLQLPDFDLTWRVASMAHWTLAAVWKQFP